MEFTPKKRPIKPQELILTPKKRLRKLCEKKVKKKSPVVLTLDKKRINIFGAFTIRKEDVNNSVLKSNIQTPETKTDSDFE